MNVGAIVEKVKGADSGCQGTISEVDIDGKKIKVIPLDSTKVWNRQLASNFRIVNGDSQSNSGNSLEYDTIENKDGDDVKTGSDSKEIKVHDDVDMSMEALMNATIAMNIGRSNNAEWNFSPETPYPPEFTKTTVRELPEYTNDKVFWGVKEYSQNEWMNQLQTWEQAYPNVVCKIGKQHSTRHETASFRSSQTCDVININYCWDSLSHTHKCIPSKYRDMFRVDMYQNVVSILASDGSLCKFDVDHVFPWCRGGRSVRSNFVACQHDANRRVKSDKLLQSLSANEMNCGLTPRQFSALLQYADLKSEEKGGGRRDKQFYRDIATQWLLRSPRNGHALTNFKESVHGSEDGEKLWSFFENHEMLQKGDMVVAVAKTVPLAETADACTPPNRRILHVRYVRDNVLECYGPHTFQLKNDFKQQLHMTYGGTDKTCWYKITDSVEARNEVLENIRNICTVYGFEVEVT